MAVEQLVSDPAAYRAALRIDCGDGGPRLLGECRDPWQEQDFQALDAGWRRVAGQDVSGAVLRAWLERPRGHSKTADVATMATWALLTPHRRLSGVAAAADQDQARLLASAIGKLCQLNRWLADLLDVQRNVIRNRHTGSELVILSNDAPSSYGLTPDFIIADEVTHWGERRELWDSLLSSAAKRSHCMLLVIGNAGWSDSWQWTTREAVLADAAWYFHALDGPQASWISPAMLAEQRRLLPAIVFDRLWSNLWTSGSGNALPPADLDAAIDASLTSLARGERGWSYIGGLDLSVSRDATGFILLGKHTGYFKFATKRRLRKQHSVLAAARDLGMMEPTDEDFEYRSIDRSEPGSGKLKICRLRVWNPAETGGRIDFRAVEEFCLKIHRRFGLSCLAIDPFQAERVAQALAAEGVPVKLVPPTAGNLQQQASAMLEAFADRALKLLPDERLIADLRRLRIVERGLNFRLESPRINSGAGTRHGDLASALALAVQASKDFDEPDGDLEAVPLSGQWAW